MGVISDFFNEFGNGSAKFSQTEGDKNQLSVVVAENIWYGRRSTLLLSTLHVCRRHGEYTTRV